MNALILVDSQFGNTARVADEIAAGFGPGARILGLPSPGIAPSLAQVDLLIVGGPTIERGMSARLLALLGDLAPAVGGLPVAVFDTRYRGPGLYVGSAARQALGRLRSAGARPLVPPKSYHVQRSPGRSGAPQGAADVCLVSGEVERARAWGRSLREVAGARRAA